MKKRQLNRILAVRTIQHRTAQADVHTLQGQLDLQTRINDRLKNLSATLSGPQDINALKACLHQRCRIFDAQRQIDHKIIILSDQMKERLAECQLALRNVRTMEKLLEKAGIPENID
jgi:hypothetical protein